MVDFATQLRTLMNAAAAAGGGKKYYLSAAPQCAFPDANNQDLLDKVAFDLVNVQFYNTPLCAANTSGFTFAQWNDWAGKKTPSPKVLMGVAADATAATNGGYLTQSQLAPVIKDTIANKSFGGVMMWDASQAWRNTGFIGDVKKALKAAK
jgi:chitinase